MAANDMPEGFNLDRDRKIKASTYHGPVTLTTQGEDGSICLVEFTGAEEGDILHSAADWMNSRRFAVIMGLNWLNAVPGAPEADDPERVLRMTVDMTGYQNNYPPR